MRVFYRPGVDGEQGTSESDSHCRHVRLDRPRTVWPAGQGLTPASAASGRRRVGRTRRRGTRAATGRRRPPCGRPPAAWRVLPLLEPVTDALEALQARQRDEMEAAGSAYENSGYVCADELGRPVYPEWYSDEFNRLAVAARLPKIRLHDTRGTMNSILEQAGVPETLRAAWFGHTIAVNRKNYLAKPKDLTPVSDSIGAIFKAA
jgi:integrase